MRFRTLALAGAGVLALSSFAAIPAQAAEGDAKLSVLHAVPGLTVDVYVDGERTINDFKPGTLAGPLELPGGTYSVAITAADADDDSDPAIGPIDLTSKTAATTPPSRISKRAAIPPPRCSRTTPARSTQVRVA